MILGFERPQEIALSPEQIERLERGEILTWVGADEARETGMGRAMGLIDAEPEQVFRVITDVERFHEFMERVKDCRITRREGDSYDFSFTIDLPWPLKDLYIVTRNENVVSPERRLYERRWTLVQGSFERNDGSWVLDPWKGGRTRAVYNNILKPKIMLPQIVVDHVARRSLPGAIKNVRGRVAELIRRKQL